MEEARVVQSFLTEVEEEMEEDITDEMTADQLLEKLERLELLQQTQSAREGEVKAIDKSADSEEVKKALQKNPDISKERNNLLQGTVYVCFLTLCTCERRKVISFVCRHFFNVQYMH